MSSGGGAEDSGDNRYGRSQSWTRFHQGPGILDSDDEDDSGKVAPFECCREALHS